MKYLIYEKLGSVYSIDEGHRSTPDKVDIIQYPITKYGTFDTEDSCIVETWDEVSEQDQFIIKDELGVPR